MNFDKYQELAALTAEYPQHRALTYLCLKLNGEAGEVAEKFGKIIRDRGGFIREEDRETLAKELGDVQWYISEIARTLGYRLSKIAEMNIAKLADRAARGVIGGSGDDR